MIAPTQRQILGEQPRSDMGALLRHVRHASHRPTTTTCDDSVALVPNEFARPGKDLS
jgi:hypothetical protein